MTLILASKSPRRQALLAALGLAFTVDAADVDETPLPGEAPADLVVRLSRAKAKAVAARNPTRSCCPPTPWWRSTTACSANRWTRPRPRRCSTTCAIAPIRSTRRCAWRITVPRPPLGQPCHLATTARTRSRPTSPAAIHSTRPAHTRSSIRSSRPWRAGRVLHGHHGAAVGVRLGDAGAGGDQNAHHGGQGVCWAEWRQVLRQHAINRFRMSFLRNDLYF